MSCYGKFIREHGRGLAVGTEPVMAVSTLALTLKPERKRRKRAAGAKSPVGCTQDNLTSLRVVTADLR